jgi:hydroxyacylglutathione hydrolase
VQVITIQVGPIAANCYLLIDEETNKCLIFDPGDEYQKIHGIISSMHLIPESIVLTHGHWDHIGAVEELRNTYSIPLYIHQDEAELLSDPFLNGAALFENEILIKTPEKFLKDSELIIFDTNEIKVLHTPGHSPGSCSFLCVRDKFLIVGDLIFMDSVGRADLPGGNWRVLLNSIKTKILPLSEDIIIYSGHGPSTTIGRELRHNPFLKSSYLL